MTFALGSNSRIKSRFNTCLKVEPLGEEG